MSDENGVKSWTTGTIENKNEGGEEIVLSYDFGNTLEATIAKYGENVVHYNACLRLAVATRNKLYALVSQEDGPRDAGSIEAILAEMAEWIPTVSQSRAKKSPADAALAASVFHYNNYPVPLIKRFLRDQGVLVRS